MEKSTDASDVPTGYQVVSDETLIVDKRETKVIMCDEPFYNIAPERPFAAVLVAAFNEHDVNATVLTEMRKTLRELLSSYAVPPWVEGKVTSIIDALNNRIIASRKLTKGELP